MNFRDHLKDQLEADPELKREWEANEPAHHVIRALVGARARWGWTQEELARRMGTTQANISRAETTGRVSPEFLARFAQAVGGSARIQIKVPGSKPISVEVVATGRKRRVTGATAESGKGRTPNPPSATAPV